MTAPRDATDARQDRAGLVVLALALAGTAVAAVADLGALSALPAVGGGVVQVLLLRRAARRNADAINAAAGVERELELAAARFTTLAASVPAGIFTADADGGLRTATPLVAEMSGLGQRELLGDGLWSRVHPDDWTARLSAHARHADAEDLLTEARVVQDDGHVRWVRLLAAPVRTADGTEVQEWVGILEDATPAHSVQRSIARSEYQQRFLAERLAHQERHDALTGLANRTWFRECLTTAMDQDQNEDESEMVGVALIDLDAFRLVNDSLGHEIGDALLLTVAERLGRCVRARDLAARLNGDEFALLIRDVGGPEQLEAVARRVLRALSMPIMVRHREVKLTASIGLAARRPDASTVELLRDADLALDAAKKKPGSFLWYQEGMHGSVVDRLEMELALRATLDEGLLRSVYQPIVELGTGAVMGSEALARWEHGLRGPVSPVEFIPLAERTGLIGQLGGQMLRRACRDVRSWSDHDGTPMYVNVNVSAHQLADPNFGETVMAVLGTTDLDPSRLVLEITESALVQHEQRANEVLGALRRQGVRIAMDDFGTGYSSLSSLRSLPLDILKIDRSFIVDLEDRPHDLVFVEAIITLAHTLDLVVVAEGIETEGQRAILLQAGCDRGQGWLFSKPLAAEDFTASLASAIPTTV